MRVRFSWSFLALGLVAAAFGGALSAGQAVAAPFVATSSTFSDGGMLTKKQAADDPMRMCGEIGRAHV